MDERTFAELSRRVAASPSRRALLATLAGGLAGSAAATLRWRPVAAQLEEEAFGFCKAPGKKCNRNVQCCAGKCRRGACGCRKNGKPASVGLICCSGHVRAGKCRQK